MDLLQLRVFLGTAPLTLKLDKTSFLETTFHIDAITLVGNLLLEHLIT